VCDLDTGRLLQQLAAADPRLLRLVAGILGPWQTVASVPSLTGEGGSSPAAAWCSSAAASFHRPFLTALVSISLSLLTAADLSFDTLVSRAPMLLAVSRGQGALVSRFPATSGAASGSEALVSCSLAASLFSGSLTGSALAQLLSISPLLHVLITLQTCLFTFLPLDT
jgi:hypothetical protein